MEIHRNQLWALRSSESTLRRPTPLEVFTLITLPILNEQGNFVFSGVDGVFPYEYHIHFMDSGIEKTKIFTRIQGHLTKLRRSITMITSHRYRIRS